MQENNHTTAEKIWLAAGIAAALGALAMPVLNPDLYWHLSAGRYIKEFLRLPAADFLSWTEQGAPWVDFEWLTQVIYYAVHALGGTPGLFALKMAVLGATFPAFYSLLALNGLRSSAFFTLPLWGLTLMSNSDLRPENFSVLFFALLLWRLEAARLAGRPGDSFYPAASPAALLRLAFFFTLWANLHAGFAYGLLLLLCYAAGGLADRKLWHTSAGPALSWRPALPVMAAAAGAMLNPWGIKIYAILIEHASQADTLSRYLAEWAPPALANPWHWPFMAFFLVSFSLLLRRFLRERSLPFAHLLTLGLLAFEAARHTRHMVFFCMAAAVFSLNCMAGLWSPPMLRRRGRVILVLTLLYLSLLVWPRYLSFRVNLGAEAAGAAAYLKTNAPSLGGRRLYNPWTWGGYLGWALNPDYKVFTDGRYIFHKYLAPVSAAMTDQDSWADFARERRFELVLFRRDYQMLPFEQAGRNGEKTQVLRPSYLLFMPKAQWALIYWDAFSVLFARRGGPAAAELKLIRPDDLESVKFDICAGALKPEAAQAELELYRKAAAGAPSTKEADRFAGWLAGYPASCRR
ncbi:MAG: hypothetical protein A2285_08000 [Elusimicrobia bacterium RIFOXYA12_FULL_57_11]|nr:MAG: hypothetical protein A2285_08000 [Elusimicrobia bacterium RIFOXYA12_FULL_57_11]